MFNRGRKIYFSYYIIGVSVLVYVLQSLSKAILGVDIPLALGAKINQLILQGQLWRLVTPILLHASIVHIGFNMYALYVLGPGLERIYGIWLFLALYIIGGVWGNTFSFFFSTSESLGASTAIFGLIAAQGVYIYKNRHLLGSAARPMLINIVMLVVINLALGLSPGIDNWGHIGGLIGGLLFAWFAGPSYGLSANVFGQNVVVKNNTQPKLIFAAGIAIPLAAVLLRIFLF